MHSMAEAFSTSQGLGAKESEKIVSGQCACRYHEVLGISAHRPDCERLAEWQLWLIDGGLWRAGSAAPGTWTATICMVSNWHWVNPRARRSNDGVAPSMRNGRTSELVRLHLSS
jgi:hypothetical protein